MENKDKRKKGWPDEALLEAKENALAALTRYGLVLFTELNQPMTWQRDDLETLAYYIDRYTEALDVFDDGYPEVSYKWLQRLEADIDYSTRGLDAVWEMAGEEPDMADAYLQEVEDRAKAAAQKVYAKWRKGGQQK